MGFDITRSARLQLPPDQILRLSDARGTRLRVVTGTGWLTIDHDPRDVILNPGDEWLVDGRQPVLLTALGGAAMIQVCTPAPSRSGVRSLLKDALITTLQRWAFVFRRRPTYSV